MIWHELIGWSVCIGLYYNTHTHTCMLGRVHAYARFIYKEEVETTKTLTKAKIPWKHIVHVDLGFLLIETVWWWFFPSHLKSLN